MKELLTGKCKEDFENWFFREAPKEKSQWNDFIKASLWSDFKYASFSMQYGVYLEFFDSVGVLIHNDNPTRSGEWEVCVNGKSEVKETRQEAQQQAIIKANSIYNERH